MAATLGISRQWLYKTQFLQQRKDELLKEQILSVWSSHPSKASYGYRRIALELGIGKKRVRRCMKLYGIKPYKRRARWRKRRDERRIPAAFQNQIRNQFPIIPNHTWVGDFTYLPFKGKFLYLATFMDLFTREIVGWHISNTHTKHLVMQAFLDGLVNRDFHKPHYIHSDQGVEYTSQDYTNLVQQFGVTVSMSTKASPWENGYQESFYNNFKTDLGLEFDRFQDEGHFLEAIHHTLYDYNHTRIHSTLKMPPAKFHACYLESMSTKRGA
ncbi:MAG: IS3 family transposase [Candidatus Kuenenia stuttgartiensis]|nr:IS3 family transposase [Candidatus Kuenenia stuttgartiensis]